MKKGWTETTIGEATAFTSKPRGLDLGAFDRVPFVPMELIPQGNTYVHDWRWKPGKDIRSGNYFEKGDCLIAKITPCFENGKQGIVCNLPSDFGMASTELIPFRGRRGLSNKFFLFYFFLEATTRRQIAQKMEGATGRQRIPISVLKDWPVSLPPLPEQKKIAVVLLKIQRAIETQEKIIQSVRDFKKSTMQHVFTHGLRGEKTKMTEIGEIPESWEVEKLGDILEDSLYGLSMRGRSTGKYPILRMNCQIDGRVVFDDLQYVDIDRNTFDRFRLRDGDLLFNRTNSHDLVGRMAVFYSDREAVFASYLIRLRLSPSSINRDFVNYYFNMPVIQNRVKRLASKGVSQSNISASKLKTFEVPITILEEQEDIVGKLRTVDGKIALHESKESALQELFKTVLNKLMTGEIRVGDLDIDVSEVEI
jgi:type I restriction enzyme S subunit